MTPPSDTFSGNSDTLKGNSDTFSGNPGTLEARKSGSLFPSLELHPATALYPGAHRGGEG